MGSRYYDRAGQPITLEQWSASFDGTRDDWIRARRVAYTERGDVRVSTVWLGTNHRYGEGPPLIFETMVFGGEHDEDYWRYSTEAEALAGHAEICSTVFRGEAAP